MVVPEHDVPRSDGVNQHAAHIIRRRHLGEFVRKGDDDEAVDPKPRQNISALVERGEARDGFATNDLAWMRVKRHDGACDVDCAGTLDELREDCLMPSMQAGECTKGDDSPLVTTRWPNAGFE